MHSTTFKQFLLSILFVFLTTDQIRAVRAKRTLKGSISQLSSTWCFVQLGIVFLDERRVQSKFLQKTLSRSQCNTMIKVCVHFISLLIKAAATKFNVCT